MIRLGIGTALACALTCSLSTVGAQAQGPDNFYLPPAGPAAAPGTVLKERPAALALAPALLQGGAGAARARTLMYQSTDHNGAPNVVTGTLIEPTAPWPGPGPRPLVVQTPGSPGQGDQCAPSKTLQEIANYAPPLDVALEFESPAVYDYVNQGYTVMVTDYQGLGTPGVHTYINREATAHAVLDAARAATRIPGTGLGSETPIAIAGYSQGGHAAGAAVELAPRYAPEVKLVGAYVGAPMANLDASLRHVDGTQLAGVIGFALNSMAASYPQMSGLIDQYANADGKRWLNDTANACTLDLMVMPGSRSTAAYTNTGQSLADLVATHPEFGPYMDAQNLGSARPSVPVLMQHASNDDVLPYAAARGLAQRWCSMGATVQFSRYDNPSIAPGFALNHLQMEFVGLNEVNGWLAARFAGAPAPNNCGALPA